MANIINNDVLNYVESLFPSLPPVLNHIENQAREHRQPIVSKDTGLFMYLITKLMNAKRILEVGCNIGYSTTWMSIAQGSDAIIDTIEINPDIAEVAENNFRNANVSDRVFIHLGAALDVIPNLHAPYDIVFIDAVKSEYKDYLNMVLPKVRQGGLILVDNVLWSGKVAYQTNDHTTRALDSFNEFFMEHEQLDATILTIGDGLGFGIKR